uniref:RNA-dependent RNA polymerase n=1 Tax=Zeugodacus cucurbitae partiti-like virus 2 TaxID=3159476 RepID=A0AAU7L0S1_9VIRU
MNQIKSEFFKQLTPGPGFAFNYQPSRLDRNALFAINRVFDKEKVSEVRTKYHRARLNIVDLRNDLKEYAAVKSPRSHTDSYYMVLESVERDLFPDKDFKITPWTHGSVIEFEDLPRNKSPGIPLKQMGYNTKGDALQDPEICKNIRKQWYAIESGRSIDLPDVACYARAQICSREKNKVRATWGFPLTVFLTEAQYFYPFIEYVKQSQSRLLAYGIEMGNGGMQYLNEMTKSYTHPNIIIGDWSKFDKTVPAWLIRDAFKILEKHINWSEVQTRKTAERWPVKEFNSKARWKRLVKYFIDTPIQLSNGERWIKHGGVPSGSCFTNLIDSIVNAIVMRYLIYQQTGQLPLSDCFLGDDSVCLTEKPINLDSLSELAFTEFSMKFNPDKSYQTGNTENMHFLGYYNLFGQPYKPIDTVIASSLYPERPVQDKFETITRFIGQAYSCFEPEDAKKFFLCARILADECNQLEDSEIENFIQTHPHQFKYLHTLGVKVEQGVKFPRFQQWDFVSITLPRACKKKFVRRYHDIHELEKCIEKWKFDEASE